MFKSGTRLLLAAAAMSALMSSAAWADGLISIIVNDPANPYWLTEGNVAKATAEKLGYTANVAAHKGDTNAESTMVDTAITNKSKAIILDPANADGSVGAIKKAVAAGIPVFLVNAEINQEGIAKGQLVSNNAQGAAMGATEWQKAMLNLYINGPTAVFGCTIGEVLDTPEYLTLAEHLLDEAVTVARREKLVITERDLDAVRAKARELAAHRTSMQQDIEKQSPTEKKWLYGAVIAKGEAHGFNARYSKKVLEMITKREAGHQAFKCGWQAFQTDKKSGKLGLVGAAIN